MSKKNIYITLFAILYVCVGLVSTIHAVSFFSLANAAFLGIILAITFEIGQAAVLFNLLTSPKQRKKVMPWALMFILTAIQVLGNIYSSYKYIITNSPEDLRYFKEPIFIWTDIPDNMATVIITYIVGAILPIVALCLTEMVISYLYDEEEKKSIEVKPEVVEGTEEKIENEPIFTPEDIRKVNDKLVEEIKEKEVEIKEVEEPEQESEQEETIEQEIEETIDKPIEEEPTQKKISPEVEEIFNPMSKSHFINM